MPTNSFSTDSATQPKRSTHYIGLLTDSRRWQRFEARRDDIFICTPPKSGTTWTQAICALLIFGRDDFQGQIGQISPWLEFTPLPIETCIQTLNTQTHRRFIKSHTPLDGIPYFADCQYLMVYRDPRDVYFSMRNHVRNLRDTPPSPQMDADPCKGFRAWLDTPFEPGVNEQRSLAFFVHHYQSFQRFREMENFHFFHYADYKRDLRGSVERVAKALDITLPDATLDALSESATFDSMKARSATFTPAFGLGIWKDDNAFFSKGENAQWRDTLGATELDHYAARIADLLPAEDIAWLENGSG